jgi:hypothetical protein
MVQVPVPKRFIQVNKCNIFLFNLLRKSEARLLDVKASEEKAEHEAKMAKILAIEEAKQRDRLIGRDLNTQDYYISEI